MFISCKHHLYLDVNPETGSIKLNFPHLEPWEMLESCSLDVAERGVVGTPGTMPLTSAQPCQVSRPSRPLSMNASGASHGYVYVRSEYPDAVATLTQAVAIATSLPWSRCPAPKARLASTNSAPPSRNRPSRTKTSSMVAMAPE